MRNRTTAAFLLIPLLAGFACSSDSPSAPEWDSVFTLVHAAGCCSGTAFRVEESGHAVWLSVDVGGFLPEAEGRVESAELERLADLAQGFKNYAPSYGFEVPVLGCICLILILEHGGSEQQVQIPDADHPEVPTRLRDLTKFLLELESGAGQSE